MNILISNDDGIDSPGLHALARAAREYGDVTVVAPHRERSTAGHSLTLHKPLRIFSRGDGFYAATGTPADCIYLGIREVLKKKPDLILSGINAGANLGTDVHYSGTVAAAREGALLNIPCFAFSLVDSPHSPDKTTRAPLNFEAAGEIAREVIAMTRDLTFPTHTLMNVNLPNVPLKDVRGVAIARQGIRFYSNDVARRTDPRGKDYYWIGGAYAGYEKSDVSDCHALELGFVSLTPITIDCTHNGFYDALRQMRFGTEKLAVTELPPAR